MLSMRNLAVSAALSAAAIQGCTTMDGVFSTFGDTVSGLETPVDVEYYPDDQVLAAAQNQFNEGNYGHAQHYFKQAVAAAPNDAEAWLGLAASYDRIRRFDEADKAYRQAAELVGGRPELYNNLGYSYLLRGNLTRAREYFLKAYELDPANETIANNLELLRDSVTYPRRG
jgi:Flp pilus assembly protein TadD